MNYLVDSIYLLNSSYSKDKITKIFIKVLHKAGIKDFVLLSNLTQVSTVQKIEEPEIINLSLGNNSISFEYKNSYKKYKIDKKDLECIITSFIIAIENSKTYETLIENVAFGLNKDYPSYNNLITDIYKEVSNYERNGAEFCVAKIKLKNDTFANKIPYNLHLYIEEVKNSIRLTDSVYSDAKNIYILFRDVKIKDGIVLIDKLKKIFKNESIGIAEWKGSYVVADLLGEIDNYIFLSEEKENNDMNTLTQDFNKILNKALLTNEEIFVVKSEEALEEENIILSFSIKGQNYSVLKNSQNKSAYSFVYVFIGDEIAEDILKVLSEL